MLFEECQGKQGVTVQEKSCPHCGNPVEIFSTDISAECDNCGFIIYNDALSCIQWCDSARECVGDEMYERLLKALENRLDLM